MTPRRQDRCNKTDRYDKTEQYNKNASTDGIYTTMTTDAVTAKDVFKQVPNLLTRLPSIAKGYYYYSIKNAAKPLSIGKKIEEIADAQSEHAAILYQDVRISYREFNEWTNRIAHFFRAQGIGPGDVVALYVENRPELLATLIGINKLGAAAAMLNTSQKGKVLEHSIAITGPKMFVVGEELLENFATVKDQLQVDNARSFLYLADTNTLVDPGTAPQGYVNLADNIAKYPSSNPILSEPVQLGDTAMYLFTSGTTGLPKATPINHKKWFKAYGSFGLIALNMKPEDVIYVTLPFYHATALLVCWGAALAGSSTLALRRRFSASEFWPDVHKYRATCFGYVGELCRYLLNQPPQLAERNHSLRKMVGNGLRPSIWKPFKERFGIEQVAELYASSEGNIGFSNLLNIDNTVGFSTAPFALVKYHEGTRDPIRNAKGRMERVQKGEPGLLIGKINKKWSFEGYTQKEATEKVILRNVFRNSDQWFNTGDVLKEIGWRHLQFVDRMGDTYRWKGENVSTTEVENIFDEMPEVEEAIVYGVEIPHTNGKAGMATVVPTDRRKGLDIDRLFRHLKDNLPAYAIPVFIRVTDGVEKTGTFKYKKSDLQKDTYQLNRPQDQVYVWLPGSASYQAVTAEIIHNIENGQYRF